MNQSELSTFFVRLDEYYPPIARSGLIRSIFPEHDYHSLSSNAGNNLIAYAQMASLIGTAQPEFTHSFLSSELSQKANKALLKWLCRQATAEGEVLSATFIPAALAGGVKMPAKARLHLTKLINGE